MPALVFRREAYKEIDGCSSAARCLLPSALGHYRRRPWL